MPNEANELNRWISRLQRKLDSMPLSKLDREELEEMLAILVKLAQRPPEPVHPSPQASAKTTKSKEANRD